MDGNTQFVRLQQSDLLLRKKKAQQRSASSQALAWGEPGERWGLSPATPDEESADSAVREMAQMAVGISARAEIAVMVAETAAETASTPEEMAAAQAAALRADVAAQAALDAAQKTAAAIKQVEEAKEERKAFFTYWKDPRLATLFRKRPEAEAMDEVWGQMTRPTTHCTPAARLLYAGHTRTCYTPVAHLLRGGAGCNGHATVT